jgi:putative transposase
MPHYRRLKIAGGTFFFTVTLADRSGDLLIRHIDRLRSICQSVQTERRFETIAVCILSDHLHAIWELPSNDTDYARRWNLIKGGFSRGLPALPRAASKLAKREKASGSAAIGSTPSAMMMILRATSTTSASIR